MNEPLEKANLLKECLKIVNELAELDFYDTDELVQWDVKFKKLVKRAKTVKRNRFFDLN